jgi:hypothetical protein
MLRQPFVSGTRLLGSIDKILGRLQVTNCVAAESRCDRLRSSGSSLDGSGAKGALNAALVETGNEQPIVRG